MRRRVIRARALAGSGERPLEDRLVVISGHRIESILPSTAASRFSGADFVGSGRYLVLPGLIDLHCHGGGGVDPAGLGGLLAAAYYHASHGTTAMLLSLFFQDAAELTRMAEVIKKARPVAPLHLLGIHLEGPWLNPESRGAIPAETIRPAAGVTVEQILHAGLDEVRVVTVAPEMPGAEARIKALVKAGVRVSLGHSQATADEVRAAIGWGATGVTHLGNAMRPFHQRETGLVGVALSDERLSAEIIADGTHLAPDTVQVFLHAKVGDLMLVSDCRALGGMPEGTQLSGEGGDISVKDGAARNSDGSLAGGIFPVWKGLVTVAGLPGRSLWQSLPLATVNPAKFLGLRNAGRIGVGAKADLVLAGPDFSIQRVFYNGEEIFRTSGEAPLPA